VQDSTQTIPVYPDFREQYLSPWINAEIKVNSKLTVNAGLRFDYQFARTEANDQYTTFSATTPNPGAGNRPGALIYAGSGPGRAGTRTFEKPKKDAWGPRLGFAYRATDKTTILGGYGIYYSGVAFDQFVGQPTTGFQANLLAPNLTNGRFPAFYLDNGFPADRVVQPPFVDPTFANGTAPIAVAEDGLTLPRFQNWSLTVKQRLTENMMLDVSYIGNRGTRRCWRWGPRSWARTSIRRSPSRTGSRRPTRASTAAWRSRCDSIPSTRTSSGGASRWAGASTMRSSSSSSSVSSTACSIASATPGRS
jgi:hypothetical protein